MKNKKALILLLLSNIISGIAQGITMLSVPWFFAREGQLDIFIWFYIATNVLGLFWVPYSGILVDKYSRKRIFLWINMVCGLVLTSVVAWGYSSGDLPLYAVAGIFVMTFLNYSIHYPNLYAFVQEITPQRLYGKITSILEIQGQATNILAGAFAVLLLEGSKDGSVHLLGFDFNIFTIFDAWKIHEIFLIDCLTYFASFIIIAFIYFVPIAKREEEEAGGLIDRLKTGLNFLNNNKITYLFGVISYTIFVTVLLEGFYLGALYVSNHLEAAGDVYASSEIAYAFGAIISGFFIRTIFKRLNIPASIIFMTLATSVIFFVLSISQSINLFYLMLFALGLTNAGTRILRVTYLFNNVPNQVFGRAASVFNIVNILLRIILLVIFALPYFLIGNHVIYCFLILSVFLLIAAGIMIKYYRKFDLKIY